MAPVKLSGQLACALTQTPALPCPTKAMQRPVEAALSIPSRTHSTLISMLA